jgi:hypothetical protein
MQTVKRLETETGLLSANVDTVDRVAQALRRMGVEFIDPGARSGAGGVGVRLRHADQVAVSLELIRKLDDAMEQVRELGALDFDETRKEMYVNAVKLLMLANNSIVSDLPEDRDLL